MFDVFAVYKAFDLITFTNEFFSNIEKNIGLSQNHLTLRFWLNNISNESQYTIKRSTAYIIRKLR